MHVHIAESRGQAATERFLLQKPNWYLRMFLKHLGISADVLAQPGGDQTLEGALLGWMSTCSIKRFVVLAMDGACDDEGRPDPQGTSWVTRNEYVADLAERYPAVLFGASVHPYRADAAAALEEAIRRGACLVKWIPSTQNIRLDDPRCVPFYELLAQHGIPLLTHCGNEHVSSRTRNQWNDPALLVHPLRRGVKVIAAHCGARLFLHERCYFKAFCRVAREHEHCYGDLSAFGVITRIPALRHIQRTPQLLAKVLYGSDFPAFVMPRSFVFAIGVKAMGEVLRETNPLEQPYQLMRKMDLPDAVFTRAGKILRLVNRTRKQDGHQRLAPAVERPVGAPRTA